MTPAERKLVPCLILLTLQLVVFSELQLAQHSLISWFIIPFFLFQNMLRNCAELFRSER